MMRFKKIVIFPVIITFLFSLASPALAYYPYVEIPKYLCEIGMQFYQQGKIEDALHEFNKALVADPNYEPALQYIEMIKNGPPAVQKISSPERKPVMTRLLAIEKRQEAISQALSSLPSTQESEFKKKISPSLKKEALGKAKIIYLNDEFWLTKPKPTLFMEIGDSLILKGNNIKQYLVLSADFLDIKRVDRDSLILLAGLRQGSTFLHLWDDKGRWTFPVSVAFPRSMFYPDQKDVEDRYKPFRFLYSADGSGYYKGRDIGGLNRESLSFSEWAGIFGDTPYGKFDASLTATKFEASTEITSYGIGLTDGKIGPFSKFNLRGFDHYKYYSPFSLSGTGLRGATLQARAFEENLAYDIFWGRRRILFGFYSPGIQEEERDEYLEGARVTLFPKQSDNYSMNFAHAYGEARDGSLKNTVFSLEANQDIKNTRLSSEYAFDGTNFAGYLNTKFVQGKLNLGWELRDIDKDFTTVISSPGGQGEIGSRFTVDYKFTNAYLSSDLDVYRDRSFFNPARPHDLNYEWNNSLFMVLSPKSDWRLSSYYSNSVGLLSPAKTGSINNVYSRRFKFFNDLITSWLLGVQYQRSRFLLSEASSYDRYSLLAGINSQIFRGLSGSLDHEASLAKAYLSGEDTTSQSFRVGLNYNNQLSASLSGNINLYYRNEITSGTPFSFLSGEDSLQTNLGLNYRPSPDFEFFLNGTLTNLWSNSLSKDDRNNLYLGWGVRLGWDLPFSWNPSGRITGIVYNDANGNMKIDGNEKGIAGVKVKIGKKEVTTDKNGKYISVARAKTVTVAIDSATIPGNYILSSPAVNEIIIGNKRVYEVNFGLTTHSAIQGFVYCDRNNNGKPDEADIFISDAELTLDAKDTCVTDTEGKYFFLNLAAGKHAISINVNSLPLEYLPLVKISNTIEINEGQAYIFNIPVKTKN